ncbi:MAG: TetR/AcrR family transcriptional regulator [Bryobacteraceae bacterium]
MASQSKTKQEIVTEFRSAEILEAARRVFAEKGFNAATVDDVADAARVAKGTLYLYFKSKRDIYLAALKQGIEAINEETHRRVEEERTIQDKLRTFIDTRVRYFEENGDFFKIYHSEFSNILLCPTQVPEDFRDLYLQQVKALEKILRNAAKHGKIRNLPVNSLALTIYDMTRALIVQRLLGGRNTGMDEDVEFLFDLIWKGMGK